jgi:hypothetical protein
MTHLFRNSVGSACGASFVDCARPTWVAKDATIRHAAAAHAAAVKIRAMVFTIRPS